MKNEKKMNNKGFSLVELIIVIAIMAVLIAVLAPQYMRFIERGRVASDNDNIKAIEGALQVYYVDPGSGPALKNGDQIKLTPDNPAAITEGNSGAILAAMKSAGLVVSATTELPKLTNKETFKEAIIKVTITEDSSHNKTVSVTTNRTDY